MKLELNFNESIYRKQMELLYNSGFGKNVEYYKNSHYLGFVLLIIGICSIINGQNFGYALIVFALGVLIPYFIFYFKNRKVLKNLVFEQDNIVSIYTQNPKVILEFTETEFKYKDYNNERDFNWTDFLTYNIIEDNIFLFTKNYEPYIIGKEEAGEENYENILLLIESKLKK
ncbi:hypothetical protein [Flavobacterium sp. NRK F7]|uniref:hypothetical protein n=1 Tax=Flavobacterium sp. NRK F7 TaxID=2954930 RepID=UPI002091DE37|nr:hypothetical protein [Flavobacterium sp. NRK F7]MCO6164067.1 hypothetical protein [Flavobacterium sp. NRK F7]